MIPNFYEEFICGRKFQIISDHIWDTNRREDSSKFKDGSIIWCKTDFVMELFSMIKSHNNNYKLITHNSDYSVNKKMFDAKPPCIKKWFAENTDFYHIDLIPLPLGLENDMGPSKGKYTDYRVLAENADFAIKNTDKIYCNFTVSNNLSRQNVLKSLKNNNVLYWDDRSDYHVYCGNMARYKFIASPPGNGLDCHRTWEAVYMGCIPIVQSHFMYRSYGNLPIIQIDDWSEVTTEWIQQKCEYIKTANYNYSPLNISYWFKRIKSE